MPKKIDPELRERAVRMVREHQQDYRTYDEPFWRHEGLAGSAISHLGPFQEFHDHSGPGGRPAAIFGFASAARLDSGLTTTQMGDQFLTQLNRLLGPRAAHARTVHVLDWSQEIFTEPREPRERTSVAFGSPAYHEPIHGGIHWASTETAHAFAGHLEEAVRSGRQAAAAIRR